MKKTSEKVSAEGVEVALNPDELDLDTAAMQAKYEQTVKEQQSHLEKEDLSDMVAEHAAKQSKVNALKYHLSISCSSVRKNNKGFLDISQDVGKPLVLDR